MIFVEKILFGIVEGGSFSSRVEVLLSADSALGANNSIESFEPRFGCF